MRAINYGTSDYITMGIKPLDSYDVEHDPDTMEYIYEQIAEYGGTLADMIDDYVNGCNEDDLHNTETLLAEHSFYYFHVAIKPGYYEGFYLDIESNFGVAYDSYVDRKDALKEIEEIRQFLIDCAGIGLVKVSPGWCTSYSDYNGTLQAIDAAAAEMRAEAMDTPTWDEYDADAEIIPA